MSDEFCACGHEGEYKIGGYVYCSLHAPQTYLPCFFPPKGWKCTRGYGHLGPCAAIPIKPSFWTRVYNRLFVCTRKGHHFFPAGDTMGGEWIRCLDCWHLDEYLPGVHEPKGYK